MLFSNVTVYQITRDLGLGELTATDQLEERLKEFLFSPCTEQQLSKMGWVPPLHAHDGEGMHFFSEGRIMLTLKREKKILPAAAIKKALDTKVSVIERETARKVKKKEKDALKEAIVQEMLTRAFSKESYLNGYISLKDNLLVIDTATHSQAEDFCALLRKTIGSLPVVPPQSNTSPDMMMTNWLQSQESPSGFVVGESAKLASPLEKGAKVTLKDQDLFTDEVLAHIETGQYVKEVRLEVVNSIDFTLTDCLQLKSVKWADDIKLTQENSEQEDAIAKFDSDFVLMAGELGNALSQLFSVMKVENPWEGDDVS